MAGRRCEPGCSCGRHRSRKPAVVDMSVKAATRRDLAVIEALDPALANGALAASALVLAEALDGENSATSKSMCARSHADLMETIRALAPAVREGDSVDELAAQRAARLAS